MVGDHLGYSVAASGSTVVAGSPSANFASAPRNLICGSRAAAYVFTQPIGGWVSGTETAKLTASDHSGNCFGYSVAADGQTVVAGAPNNPDVANDHLTVFLDQ